MIIKKVYQLYCLEKIVLMTLVIKTEDENLDVIISGPSPFNPSDMLLK